MERRTNEKRNPRWIRNWWVILCLIMVGASMFNGRRLVFAQQSHSIEVTVEEDEGEVAKTKIMQDICYKEDCNESEVTIIGQSVVKKKLWVEYDVTVRDDNQESNDNTNYDPDWGFDDDIDMDSYTDEGYVMITDATLEGEKLDEYLIGELQKSEEGTITGIESVETLETIYKVTYQLYSESEEYKLSMGEFLKMPYTKKDSKAQLSKVDFYIQGYRTSYLLEDGGEYYIPDSDYDTMEDRYNLFTKNPKKSFYNLNWKSVKKAGAVIGSIKKMDTSEKYEINKGTYVKLSQVLPEWRTKLTYDKKTKTLYYGTKPDKTEKKLREDDIYKFTMTAIKGCKTDEQKLEALHDAIILRCTYDAKNYTYSGKLAKTYAMNYNQALALYILREKKGICENYARLYQECCKRLFLPCDLVVGQAGGDGHMWNRVYLGKKAYHVDVTFDDPLNNTYKKKSDVRHTFFMKTADYFMGSHNWYGDDCVTEKFSKSWKKIDRNNIKTTKELRRAAVYTAYLCRDGKKRTYKFRIKSNQVQISCLSYIMKYGFVYNAMSSYNDGVLTITYNINGLN